MGMVAGGVGGIVGDWRGGFFGERWGVLGMRVRVG